MNEIFLSLDIGTSSVRAVLFDRDGMLKNISSIEYSLTATVDGRAEINADHVFDSTLQVIRSCMDDSGIGRTALSGIGISCHMHSLLLLDGAGRPLSNVMTWADGRAAAEAEYIARSFNVSDLYNRTGCRVQHPMYPLSKILWYAGNEPETFKKAQKFVTIKEYILYKLYGVFAVDYTLASSQGYYNIHTQSWDGGIIRDILGITEDKLSEVVECTHIFRGFKKEYEELLGISRDTPVVIGSGDGILANIGCGVTDDTALSSTVGTSGAVRTAVDSPLLDSRQRTWCYSFTKDMWVAGGAINNGGIVLKWLREEFRKQFEYDAQQTGESIYKLFDAYAAEIAPGSEGLIFLPYLMGERSPNWNAGARGIMYGLGYAHNRKHIIRAAMEGVMFRMYSVYEVMMELRDNATQIRANGGYTKSDLWLQIQADIFNKEILVPEVQEASSLGAAFLCMAALGLTDLKKVLPGMRPVKKIRPIDGNHEIYMKAYELSKKIYYQVYPDSKGE